MSKNIVILSDGTGQTNDQDCLTNIGKLEQILEQSERQVVFYDPGVGTNWQKWTGRVSGRGIKKNVEQGRNFIVSNYEKGDKIYMFGFSRGAATVRMVAAILNETRQEWHDLHITYNRVEFLGCFDTVAQLGCQKFNDYKLSSNVKKAYHALSIDEPRKRFTPALWDWEDSDRIKQVWFAGVHSDIGGGYCDDGLSDVTLKWMLEKAITQGVRISKGWDGVLVPNINGTIHNPIAGWRRFFWKQQERKWPENRPDCAELHMSALDRKDYIKVP